jgi:hypothetical protein
LSKCSGSIKRISDDEVEPACLFPSIRLVFFGHEYAQAVIFGPPRLECRELPMVHAAESLTITASVLAKGEQCYVPFLGYVDTRRTITHAP